MVRKLAIIFGDQLNLDSSLFSNLDPEAGYDFYGRGFRRVYTCA